MGKMEHRSGKVPLIRGCPLIKLFLEDIFTELFYCAQLTFFGSGHSFVLRRFSVLLSAGYHRDLTYGALHVLLLVTVFTVGASSKSVKFKCLHKLGIVQYGTVT